MNRDDSGEKALTVRLILFPAPPFYSEARQIQQEHHAPGKGLRIGDNHVAENMGKGIGGDDPHDQGQNSGKAGIQHVPGSLQEAARCGGETEYNIEDGKSPEKVPADFHHLRTGSEQGDQRTAHRNHQTGEEKGDYYHHSGSYQKGFVRLFFISGSAALRHESGNAGAQVGHGENNDGIHPVGCGDGCHGLAAEAVHEVLQDQIAKGVHTGLDHGRKAKPDAFPQGGFPDRIFPDAEPDRRIFENSVGHKKDRHRDLGNYCGNGSAGYAPVQHGHQPYVQNDVDCGGKQDGEEGRPAVSQSPQRRRVYIVNREKGNSKKNDLQIVCGQVKGIRSCVHQTEHLRSEHDAYGSQQKKNGTKQDGKGGKDAGHLFRPPASELLRKKNGQSQGEACERQQIKIDDAAGGAYGGQSQFSVHVSHHERVHPVIKLLENAA